MDAKKEKPAAPAKSTRGPASATERTGKASPGKRGTASKTIGGRGTAPGDGERFGSERTGSATVAALRKKAKRRRGFRRVALEVRESETGRDTSVRGIFLRRMNAWSRSLAENTPPEVLADALAYPTARGSILHVLELVPQTEEKGEAELLREKALQRALSVREELAREAEGMMSTQEVAEQLGVKRQSVDRYRARGRLLAWETPQGYVFPRCQFDADGVVPGLDEVLGEMEGLSFWEALSGLVTPTPTLAGRSVLDALRTGAPDQQRKIRDVVRAYAAG